MKAISLWQPWASLIGRGKVHETRHWSTAYRGPIAIHAAKRWNEEMVSLCQTEPFRGALRGMILSPKVFGAIVAVANLTRCIPTEHISTDGVLGTMYSVDGIDYQFGNYEHGRFAWRFEDIHILSEPVPYRGAQGLFNVPDELLRDILSLEKYKLREAVTE
jgi:hypothetical protein